MKFDLSKKIVGAGLLATTLAVMPLAIPTAAQTNTTPNQTTVEDNTKPTFDTTPLQETKTDRNNWGWLGLIGLIGLANLFRKNREPEVYREPDTTTRSETRY